MVWVIELRTFNDPSLPENNKILKPPDEDELQNTNQEKPKDVSATCSICTEDFIENDTVRILPCGHLYHRRCIDPWLLRFGGNCPLW
jgi:hypothetical protein